MSDESSLAQLMAVFSSTKTILRILSWTITDLENKLDAIGEELDPSNKSTAETSSTVTKSIPIRDVKIETRMAIQDKKEEEEQKRALEQIEDCAEETRSCGATVFEN
ncbi:hypothetical protein EIK77_001181 [Talaromyces pinophilus]|nr:hypothetical protein EIK77_001181 [Talaromyces pinophilus]